MDKKTTDVLSKSTLQPQEKLLYLVATALIGDSDEIKPEIAQRIACFCSMKYKKVEGGLQKLCRANVWRGPVTIVKPFKAPPTTEAIQKPKSESKPGKLSTVEKLDRADEMRANPTPAEAAMAAILATEYPGMFKSQIVKKGYILDFYCSEHKLIVEVDGKYHIFNGDHDRKRDSAFAADGIKTLRFRNEQVLDAAANDIITNVIDACMGRNRARTGKVVCDLRNAGNVFSQDKITEEGQACRKCGTPVVRATHSKTPKYKEGGYYFKSWMKCPNRRCRTTYMLESEKVYFDKQEAA